MRPMLGYASSTGMELVKLYGPDSVYIVLVSARGKDSASVLASRCSCGLSLDDTSRGVSSEPNAETLSAKTAKQDFVVAFGLSARHARSTCLRRSRAGLGQRSTC